MARTRIKICGLSTLDTALAAVEAGADALGFVFVASSPRAIDPEAALDIAAFLPPFITKVGLFVDATPDEILDVGEVFPFDVVQLHGAEDEKAVRAVREIGLPIVKAIRFDPGTIEAELRRWSGVGEIDALLIDGSSGGAGDRFDWNALARAQDASDHPIIVAGGLDSMNVGVAVRTLSPYAVDVSSGVESTRGVKDPALIERFCSAVQSADASA